MRILFVCLGNICRSPTAEAVMRGLVADAGLEGEIVVDSAGTGDWHVGQPPDERAVRAGEGRGVMLGGEARLVGPEDFDRFDLVVAMDRANESDLRSLAPVEHRGKISLLRSWDPEAAAGGELDVPDPYWSGADGFDHVLDVVESACAGLLAEIEERGGERAAAKRPG